MRIPYNFNPVRFARSQTDYLSAVVVVVGRGGGDAAINFQRNDMARNCRDATGIATQQDRKNNLLAVVVEEVQIITIDRGSIGGIVSICNYYLVCSVLLQFSGVS